VIGGKGVDFSSRNAICQFGVWLALSQLRTVIPTCYDISRSSRKMLESEGKTFFLYF